VYNYQVTSPLSRKNRSPALRIAENKKNKHNNRVRDTKRKVMESLETYKAKEYFRDSRDIVPPLKFTEEG
jgi:hypothetical protein